MPLRVLTIALFVTLAAISMSTYAGNPGNSSAVDNVTAYVWCEADETEAEDPPEVTVEVSRVAISADACECEVQDPEGLNCQDDDPCTLCLATLQRSGLNIFHSNEYVEPVNLVEDQLVTIYHHYLTGNAGPFLDRLGGCPCPD